MPTEVRASATPRTPTRIEPLSPLEIFLSWNSGENYSLPFQELRFQCPCASCIDEHTGERTLKRESISATVRPTHIQLVGKYAIQITWSDHHSTGIYHFDRLFALCEKYGHKLPASS